MYTIKWMLMEEGFKVPDDGIGISTINKNGSRRIIRRNRECAMGIIITNDDGIDAPGIRALYAALDGIENYHRTERPPLRLWSSGYYA
jgi:hypothetical protein